MLSINVAISMSTGNTKDIKENCYMAIFLATAMAEVLAPYSTDQYAVVGKYIDSQGRSIASFVSSCKSTKVKVYFGIDIAQDLDKQQEHQISNEKELIASQSYALPYCVVK